MGKLAELAVVGQVIQRKLEIVATDTGIVEEGLAGRGVRGVDDGVQHRVLAGVDIGEIDAGVGIREVEELDQAAHLHLGWAVD